MNPDSTLTIHMVCSLDGFIATPDGSIDWMRSHDHYPGGKVLTEEAIAEFLADIDCYLMGSRTYEQALQLGWPYGDTPAVVLTHRELRRERETVSFLAGDLQALIQKKLAPHYSNIWLVGGADVAKQALQQGLAHQLVVSMLPVLLGEGVPFFDAIGIEQRLHLKEVQAYQDGMVEITYEV